MAFSERNEMMWRANILLLVISLTCESITSSQYTPGKKSLGELPYSNSQQADSNFKPTVTHPTYVKVHPKVLFDGAHNNSSVSLRQYAPFISLTSKDGYKITTGTEKFSTGSLKQYSVLIIVNASGPEGHRDAPAFTDEECDAVRDWVSRGGALLLVTDQAPYSAAASSLSKRFGVDLTIGYTIDKVHYNKDANDQTELVFTRADGLVVNHPITNGYHADERIDRVISFTGTSVKGPTNSVAFLKLSDTAFDVLPAEIKPGSGNGAAQEPRLVSAAGRAQGVAFELGKGRAVFLSEAAMLTAQVTPQGVNFGMNVAGFDNSQLALNIMHWLSGK